MWTYKKEASPRPSPKERGKGGLALTVRPLGGMYVLGDAKCLIISILPPPENANYLIINQL